MAINAELDKDKSLKSRWKNGLGRTDEKGHSFLRIAAETTAFALSGCFRGESNGKLKTTFNPLPHLGIAAVPGVFVALMAAIITDERDAPVQFDQTMMVQEISSDNAVLSISGLENDDEYLLITSGDHVELYKAEIGWRGLDASDEFELLPQLEAYRVLTQMNTAFTEASADIANMPYSIHQVIDDVRLPVLDDDGLIIRDIDDVEVSSISYNVRESYPMLAALTSKAAEQSLTVNYGFNSDDLATLEANEPNPGIAALKGLSYTMLSVYALLAFLEGHFQANRRTSRRKEEETPKP